MPRRTALVVMTVSILSLVAIGVVWLALGAGEERADLLSGPATTTTTAPVTTTTTPDTTTTSTTVAPPAVPVGLVIPSLGVDARVVPVGLEPNGEMEVPPADEAGWYFYGPRPGQGAGTAVLAAHVDYGGQRGVFFDLRGIQVGAEITVTDEVGTAHRYTVAELLQVDKDELPIDQIFVADGPPGLTLITCGGAFDRGVRSYEDNIVVRAVPA